MRNRRFTFIEKSLIFCAIILIGAFIVTQKITNKDAGLQETICFENRRLVESAEEAYYTEKWQHSTSMLDLVTGGYLEEFPQCPAGGAYAWMRVPENNPLHKTILLCSEHRSLDAGGEDMTALEEIYDIDFNVFETGWYQFRSKSNVNVEDLSRKGNITDIMTLNEEGNWDTHTCKDGKFETVKIIQANSNFWIYVEKEEKKLLMGTL